MKLIDKDVVVEEIGRRIKGLQDCHADTVEGYAGEISGLKRLLSLLDTYEVKEVDLEKELKNCLEKEGTFIDDNREVRYYNGDSFNHIYEI